MKLDKNFELMDSLARIVASKHPSSVEDDLKKLFEQWASDGLRLVNAAIEANPSISKQEKAINLEVIKKTFAEGQSLPCMVAMTIVMMLLYTLVAMSINHHDVGLSKIYTFSLILFTSSLSMY